jgi:hypothetical protein
MFNSSTIVALAGNRCLGVPEDIRWTIQANNAW